MAPASTREAVLKQLNPQQRDAVLHGEQPLLIIAGAGTGKTQTLVYRVADLIDRGTDPGRILLLTFTRRAAAEMLRRVDALLRSSGRAATAKQRTAHRRVWGGTFHALAARLLRLHGYAIGLDPDFTILDRGDAEDLLNVIRTQMELASTTKRFPKKGTCLSIYSHCVNSRLPLDRVLEDAFPWCGDYHEELKKLFQAYVDRKDAASVLDYDDLLLFWHGLLSDAEAGDEVRKRFDCVLVDEYQDTNALQAEVLKMLRPDGTGVTVVGDDCQSIYAFRAATVRNILDFPKQFIDTRVVTLEQNYRSTEPILQATNNVIAQATEQFKKNLWSHREQGEKPHLVICEDEDEQTDEVIRQILEHREAGLNLRDQAVLFRTGHHSIVLEGELARHKIPFVKYGGLKFIETAHVKDLMAFLRLAENPKDEIAGGRLLTLLPGIGPVTASGLMDTLRDAGGDFSCWRDAAVPRAATPHWKELVKLLDQIARSQPPPLATQVFAVRQFYAPLLENRYDAADARLRDLEQIEQLASRFPDRRTMLSDIALDPPSTTEDFAGQPLLDEDYLILSTIHSAKGLEWDAVYVIHASDGNIPSDMAAKNPAQIDEECRLFYVALTRAKDWLYVYCPQRYYAPQRGRWSDSYGMAQVTRFVSSTVKKQFHCRAAEPADADQPQVVGSRINRQTTEYSPVDPSDSVADCSAIMELHHLQSFVAAAECENFTHAAKKLGITQPAVSKHIALLEEDLQTPLFERSGRSVTPTESGRRLYGHAVRILDLVQQARQDLGLPTATAHGTLHIAASTVPAESLLPDLLARFKTAQPEVQVSVSVSDSRDAADEVQQGDADVAIIGELSDTPHLEPRAIADDELVLIVPTGHQLAGRQSISAHRLRDEPLVVREPGSASRRCVEGYLQAAGLALDEVTIAMEMNSNDAIRSAVQRGVGIAFQSRRAVAHDLEADRLRAIKIRGVRMVRKLYAVTDSRHAPTPALRAFLDYLEI